MPSPIATWYNVSVGLTACGKLYKDTDFIVAAPQDIFENYPGATKNPNK